MPNTYDTQERITEIQTAITEDAELKESLLYTYSDAALQAMGNHDNVEHSARIDELLCEVIEVKSMKGTHAKIETLAKSVEFNKGTLWPIGNDGREDAEIAAAYFTAYMMMHMLANKIIKDFRLARSNNRNIMIKSGLIRPTDKIAFVRFDGYVKDAPGLEIVMELSCDELHGMNDLQNKTQFDILLTANGHGQMSYGNAVSLDNLYAQATHLIELAEEDYNK